MGYADLEKLRNLFDLGVTISLGDDGILVVGRDFHHINGTYDDNQYLETMYEFDRENSISDMVEYIIRKKND